MRNLLSWSFGFEGLLCSVRAERANQAGVHLWPTVVLHQERQQLMIENWMSEDTAGCCYVDLFVVLAWCALELNSTLSQQVQPMSRTERQLKRQMPECPHEL